VFWRKYKKELQFIPDGSKRGVLKYAWLPTTVYNESIFLKDGDSYDLQLGKVWLDYYVVYETYDIETRKWKSYSRAYNCNKYNIEALKDTKYTEPAVWLYWEIKNKNLLEKELKKELKKESQYNLNAGIMDNIYKLEPKAVTRTETIQRSSGLHNNI
jgi:hypothetical protein